ncbi:hypothetical protein J6590_067303 [Homalodisca vitripennis]|nr:hypothetical protein J6590_067303 [Homalodisca vitripennis]
MTEIYYLLQEANKSCGIVDMSDFLHLKKSSLYADGFHETQILLSVRRVLRTITLNFTRYRCAARMPEASPVPRKEMEAEKGLGTELGHGAAWRGLARWEEIELGRTCLSVTFSDLRPPLDPDTHRADSALGTYVNVSPGEVVSTLNSYLGRLLDEPVRYSEPLSPGVTSLTSYEPNELREFTS